MGEDTEQDSVIDRIEELRNVNLQRPTRAGKIFADAAHENLQTTEGGMRSLPTPTGVTVEDERVLQCGRERSIHRVVNHAVADCCLVNHSRLGIKDPELSVGAMAVAVRDELVAQPKQVVLQVPLELLDVMLLSLPSTECTPGREQVLS